MDHSLDRLTTLMLSLAVCLLPFLLVGCSGDPVSVPDGPTKMQQIRAGMTVAEIEKILGAPTFVLPYPAHKPEKREERDYPGDGDAKIIIWFDDGVAIRIYEHKPRHRLPVG